MATNVRYYNPMDEAGRALARAQELEMAGQLQHLPLEGLQEATGASPPPQRGVACHELAPCALMCCGRPAIMLQRCGPARGHSQRTFAAIHADAQRMQAPTWQHVASLQATHLCPQFWMPAQARALLALPRSLPRSCAS